jgi:hypothetical protein
MVWIPNVGMLIYSSIIDVHTRRILKTIFFYKKTDKVITFQIYFFRINLKVLLEVIMEVSL